MIELTKEEYKFIIFHLIQSRAVDYQLFDKNCSKDLLERLVEAQEKTE